jgi:hypothetical protein
MAGQRECHQPCAFFTWTINLYHDDYKFDLEELLRDFETLCHQKDKANLFFFAG